MGSHLDEQKLWCCRWGTMTALVWARSAANAEFRVRHQCFDRRATLHEIVTKTRFISTDVLVREATDEDKALFVEWGGEVPA